MRVRLPLVPAIAIGAVLLTGCAGELEAAERAAAGWAQIGEGIQGLKATDDRLRGFGCLPTEDPWK
ncbi:hypothetical protein [Streptomyces sp. NPDC059957]|uniref:hypothetical protein n=1 Tax=unclassified Streptomyces TaxID=2593676 RepID=UPI0036657958